MPAGAAASPRGLPAGLARFGALPEGEVAGVALVAFAVGVGGLHDLVRALVGQLPVGRVGADVEVDVAGTVVGGVCVPRVDEAPHQFDHLRHMAGGARLDGGRQAAQGVVGVGEGALVALAHLPPRDALPRRRRDDLVIDVGDVAAEGDLVAEVGQPSAQDVEVDSGADVTDVRGSLHRGTAQVQGGTPFAEWGELADLSGTGVIEAQTHAVKTNRFPLTNASQTWNTNRPRSALDSPELTYVPNRIRPARM